jgi:hypothetical protein
MWNKNPNFDLSITAKATKTKPMIKAFKIFKEGTTKDWVTILIPEENFNDELLQSKISFYTYLGYSIKSI